MTKSLTSMHYIIMLILAFVPLVMVLVAFPFIPDPMPAHFGIGGDVTRFGSKYESFLLPVIAVAMGLGMMWATKYTEKKDDHIGMMMFYVTVVTAFIMIATTAFILYMVMTY
jgi:uncharacterized membrane protein